MELLKNIPQGLKPLLFRAFIGTTEVMPCYKTISRVVFPQPVNPIPFRLLFAERHVVSSRIQPVPAGGIGNYLQRQRALHRRVVC